MIASFLVDAVMGTVLGLTISRVLGFLSLTLLLISALSTAVPNYINAMHLETALPHCAPEFNRFLQLFVGDLVGLGCAGLFSVSLMPILLAVVPALVRSSKLILVDRRIRRQLRRSAPVKGQYAVPSHSLEAPSMADDAELEPLMMSTEPELERCSSPSQSHASLEDVAVREGPRHAINVSYDEGDEEEFEDGGEDDTVALLNGGDVRLAFDPDNVRYVFTYVNIWHGGTALPLPRASFSPIHTSVGVPSLDIDMLHSLPPW